MSQTTDRMIEAAPVYYQTSKLYRAMIEAQSGEYDTIETQIADVVAQFRVQTATWGLRYYEETLGIPTDETDTLDNRRGRILARYRSPGNFSAALLKAVAASFVNGEIDVSFDAARSTFIIRFSGPFGAPPRIDDIKAAINNVLHAHLGVEYSFRYLLIREIHEVFTINKMQQTKIKNFAG